jgi:DNA polymerase III subunit gamma/tau
MTEDSFVSLYRRFRPGRFDELRGQEHVVRALRTAVRDNRVSHAYLFSGPRGTGKTSSARILAKALNCEAPEGGEPCGKCTSCLEITQGTSLNVHELDAASNNGVDAMRDLVAHAGLGTPGRWKVYIVDEVHMLSTPAANALLKTLEEPPGHVVFVLATTDPQKVPPTIRSRTQHLEFRLLGADTLYALLQSIREEAGLDVDEDSVQAAVRRGHGSARDALSALDQVVASGSSDSTRPELASVVSAISEGEVGDVLRGISELLAGGWGPQQLATELVDDFRQMFLAGLAPDLCASTGAERKRFADIGESMGLPRVVRGMELLGSALVDMRDAPDAQVVLEIALVRAARPGLDSGVEALNDRVAALERSLSNRATAGPQPTLPVEAAPPAIEGAPAVAAPTTPATVERRPSLGAVRRRGAGTGASDGPVPVAPPIESVSPVSDLDEGAKPEPNGLTIDRDTLTQAWGDGILGGLPARAKALFSAGRFVAVVEGSAEFALPNAAHRDRCEELRPLVEAALTKHFGQPVPLVLVIDDGREGAPAATTSPRRDPGGFTPHAEAPIPEELEVQDLRAATDVEADQASAAHTRLLDAFPGTSEVDP